MENLIIASCNVRGIREQSKRQRIFKYLKEKSFEIALLQETHSTEREENFWQTQYGGKIYYSHGTSNSKGVAILLSRQTKAKLISIRKDNAGRWILIKVDYEGEELNVLNIYAPNDDNPEFYEQLGNILAETEGNIIIGGDFNLVPDVNLDKVGGKVNTHVKARIVLNKIKEELELIDIWRYQHHSDKEFTWKKFNPDIILERLDYFLVSADLKDKCVRTDIVPSVQTDHDIPTLTIKNNKLRRGPGFWKFNTSLLQDEQYNEAVREIITEEKKEKYELDSFKWDFIKSQIRGFTVKYSARKKRSKENTLAILDKKIKKQQDKLTDKILENEIFSNIKENKQHMEKLIRERDEIIEQKVRGSLVRNRREWLQYGEKNSKMFFSLERANYKRKNRYQLINEEGKMITENKLILKEQHKFYTNLFTSKNIPTERVKNYLKTIDLPKLTEEDNEILKQDISVEEIKAALWEMKPDKVPGPEGFPPEFYRHFWPEIGKLIFYVLTSAAKHGFSKVVRRGVVTLMEKEGSNMLKLQGWRPLTLLSTELKILSKVLAARLNKVLPRIIGKQQTGFLKGRGIQDNVINLITALETCEKDNLPAFLISFDYYKAFDSIEHNVLFSVMEKFNFCPEYIEMIKNMFKGIESCTVNQGYASDYINITRSLRQGDPISSSLFLLVVEALGEKIRLDGSIEGIIVNNEELKHGQYADDLWAIVKGTQNNINNILLAVEHFSYSTGLRLNYDKTEIMRVGSLKNSEARYYAHNQIKWSEGTKILGTRIRADREEMIAENFDILLNKMGNVLNRWRARNLTLSGRVQVVNTLVSSLATQKFTCLPTPKDTFFEKAKEIIRGFLWKGGKAKIAYEKLIQDNTERWSELDRFKSKGAIT